MNIKIKVIKEEGGFVGYLLSDEEIVYKTIVYADAMSASNALTQYASNQSVQSQLAKNKFKLPFELNASVRKQLSPTINPSMTPLTNRSCCGRG
jgi:hypothetical protein